MTFRSLKYQRSINCAISAPDFPLSFHTTRGASIVFTMSNKKIPPNDPRYGIRPSGSSYSSPVVGTQRGSATQRGSSDEASGRKFCLPSRTLCENDTWFAESCQSTRLLIPRICTAPTSPPLRVSLRHSYSHSNKRKIRGGIRRTKLI